MRVRIISFGTNWWGTHSLNLTDPYCFRRHAAWFNSAALKYGSRLRFCWIVRGHIRFNQTSGFNPEFVARSVGQTFLSSGPRQYAAATHLLFTKRIRNCLPEAYLVTLSDGDNGGIAFNSPGWKSAGVQPISVSLRRSRYEAMLLLRQDDWVETNIGRWRISDDGKRLVLSTYSIGDVA
jgi:hypothetical protein